jgi:K+-sensing histidine kinase KdpD
MNEIEKIKNELKQTKLAYHKVLQMSQFKAGFLARTAHELRSPISSLMGLHQLIICDLCDDPEEERKFLNEAYQSAQKLIKILDQIIAVSKLDYGSIPLEINSIQLAALFTEVAHVTSLQAANRNLNLQIFPPHSDLYILADSHSFLQVLIILIDTAIKFTEGEIKVWAEVSDCANLVQIIIETKGLQNFQAEPTDLLQQTPEASLEAIKSCRQTLEISPGMKLLLAQTLLETMEGQLEIIQSVSEIEQKPVTRLKCLIPKGSPQISPQQLILNHRDRNYAAP